MPDAIKRTADNVFWTEWAAVTAHTRELLRMYEDHDIVLTVNARKLAEAIHQQDVRNKEKAALTAPTAKTAEKVENIGKFPPLIIPQ